MTFVIQHLIYPYESHCLHANATLYRCGIVHGDVTPYNIFLDFGYNALLGDIAHGDELTEDVTHTTATNAVLTPGYEDQYRAKGDRVLVSEDLFSLGIGLVFNLYTICINFSKILWFGI